MDTVANEGKALLGGIVATGRNLVQGAYEVSTGTSPTIEGKTRTSVLKNIDIFLTDHPLPPNVARDVYYRELQTKYLNRSATTAESAMGGNLLNELNQFLEIIMEEYDRQLEEKKIQQEAEKIERDSRIQREKLELERQKLEFDRQKLELEQRKDAITFLKEAITLTSSIGQDPKDLQVQLLALLCLPPVNASAAATANTAAAATANTAAAATAN